jgi:hypothetical protein
LLTAVVVDVEAIRRFVKADAVDGLAVNLNVLSGASHNGDFRYAQPT